MSGVTTCEIKAQEATSSSASLLVSAKAAFAHNDLYSAEARIREYMAAEPRAAEGMYLMGRILERRHQPTQSLSWFTKAASLRSPTGEDLRIVAMDYVLLGDYNDSFHWLTRSVELSPSNAESWYDLGRTLMMQGNFHAAQHPLEKALALSPKSVKAENNLGVILEAENEMDEAEEAYKKAIAWQEASPHPSEQPLLNYGTLLVAHNRTAEALPLLRRAAAIAPGDMRCNEELARALDQNGEFVSAVVYMKQAVQLQPDNARLHFELGKIYRHAGQHEMAKQESKISQQLYGSHSSPSDTR